MTTQAIVETIGSVIDRRPFIRVCLLFGSAVQGRLARGSDIDIAVAGEEPLDDETMEDLRAALEGRLSSSVDLLDLQRVNGLILKESLVGGLPVRICDDVLYARLLSRMLSFDADMMPNYRLIVDHAAHEFADGPGGRSR